MNSWQAKGALDAVDALPLENLQMEAAPQKGI